MDNGTSVVSLLEAGLRSSRLQSKAIAANIANLDTPRYRRVEVDFKKFLANALRASEGGRDLPEAELHRPMDTELKSNGNDVALDMEVGEMIKNSAVYKTYMRILSKQYKHMEMAMRGDL